MNIGVYEVLVFGLMILFCSGLLSVIVGGHKKLVAWINFFACLVVAASFSWIAAEVLVGGKVPGSVLLDLGFARIPLLIDGLSALFIAIISLLSVVTAFYSIDYMDYYSGYGVRSYYFNFPLFLAGMIGIVTVDDLSLGFSIAWQLMTITSYFLIRFEHRDRVILRSAGKYLILMELAWIMIVVGSWLVPGSSLNDTLQQTSLHMIAATPGARSLILALVLGGFALKAGVFPLGQLWLPDAHSVAPSPISALLSGVMIKTGVYGILRTLLWMVPADNRAYGPILGVIVASFGVVTLFIGTVQALKQHDAKRLHAYHSIGQMGYIILGIGSAYSFYFSDNPFLQVLAIFALLGALYHTLNHAIFKGLLFLCTGSVQYATGMKDLNKLGGLIKLMPITTVIAAIASASIAGVPAFSGFISKWSILFPGLAAGRDFPLFALFGIVGLMTGAITLASYVKFFGMTFTTSGIEWSCKKEVHEVSKKMLFSKMVLALFCLLQGLFPLVYLSGLVTVLKASEGGLFVGLLQRAELKDWMVSTSSGISVNLPGATMVSAVAVPLLLVFIFGVIYIAVTWLAGAGGSQPKSVDVWLCGYKPLCNNNRFKSADMYAAFKDFMKWTGGNVK